VNTSHSATKTQGCGLGDKGTGSLENSGHALGARHRAGVKTSPSTALSRESHIIGPTNRIEGPSELFEICLYIKALRHDIRVASVVLDA